jgi:hypothetical protein
MPMRCLGKTLIIAFVVAIGLFSLGAALACAQDQQSEDTSKPKPAGRAYPPVGYPDQDPSGDQDSTPPLQPDTRPLTGVQNPTLGSPEIRHSYWMPGFQYNNMIRSTALNQANAPGWNSTSYITGNVSLLQAWSNSQLSVNYSGGGFFSTDSSQGNGYIHQFGLVQTFKWQRWQLALLDQFSYLPETSFGFGVRTGISAPGVGGSLGPSLPGLQNSYLPNQSILTSFGARYSNSITTQAVYAFSPRSSINVAATYGILRFLQAGNVNSDDMIFDVGYNYTFGKKDTIGVLYRLTADRFPGNPQALNDHVAQAAYGRKITGRLALQLFGGPEIITFRVPIGNETQQVRGSGGAALNCAWGRNNLSLTYTHGLSNGSGAQIGSSTDQVQSGLARRLSRHWQGNVNFGYARNGSLGNSGVSQNSQVYNSYYASGSLSRPLGRDANLSLAYTAQIQASSQAVCAAGTCNTSYTQHQITLGFSWHARPFVLR